MYFTLRIIKNVLYKNYPALVERQQRSRNQFLNNVQLATEEKDVERWIIIGASDDYASRRWNKNFLFIINKDII